MVLQGTRPPPGLDLVEAAPLEQRPKSLECRSRERDARLLLAIEKAEERCRPDDLVHEVAMHLVLQGGIFFKEEAQWTYGHSEEMRMFTEEQRVLVIDIMMERRAREAERVE